MKYLGIEGKRPKIGVFDLTSCQGCELQLANREETLVAFLEAIEIASFREISTAHSDADIERTWAIADDAFKALRAGPAHRGTAAGAALT